MDPPILFSEPIKQEAWHRQVKEEIGKERRPIDKMSTYEIDKMSTYEIVQMYKDQKFVCDSCGKELSELQKRNITLEGHIIHIINPLHWWACDDCFRDDLRNNRVIAMTD